MKLNEPFILKLPDKSRNPEVVRQLQSITETLIDSVTDSFVRKTITANIKGFPFPVHLWDKADYDSCLWTNESAQARLDELVPNIEALKALIPEGLKKYNP